MPDIDNLILLAIAFVNTAGVVYAAYQATRARMDIRIVEKATNSMKDALVKATQEKAFSAGKEEGRVEGEAKAATLARGKLAGSKERSTK